MLRREDLCKGGPRNCPRAALTTCQKCGLEWTPPDIRAPGQCPECQSPSYLRQPCSDCDITQLNQALESSSHLRLINAATALNYLLNKPGGSVSLDDVTMDVYATLRLIDSEHNRYTEEKQEEMRREMERKSMEGHGRGRR